jgi:hypothetical protein
MQPADFVNDSAKSSFSGAAEMLLRRVIHQSPPLVAVLEHCGVQ